MTRIYSEAEEKKIREQAEDMAAAFGYLDDEGVIRGNIYRIKSAIEGVEQETGLSMADFADPSKWVGGVNQGPNRHDRRRAGRGLKPRTKIKVKQK